MKQCFVKRLEQMHGDVGLCAWCCGAEYMNRAAACKADPLERLKLVVTWLIAGECHTHTP